MNVTQYQAGMQTEPNGNTLTEQTSCEGNLNGRQLSYMETPEEGYHSGVYHLELLCRRHCDSIVNKTIKKAKETLCYEFPKMEKYNMNQEDIDYLNEALEQIKQSFCQHQFFSINNEGCVIGHIGKPKYKKYFSRFEFECFNPDSKFLYKSGIYIFTGELENGLVFLKLPRLAMDGTFMHYSPEFNRIVWCGDTTPTPKRGGLNFYSLCVGESFEKVSETFKKINCCTLLACLVEDMLQKKYFRDSTDLTADDDFAAQY